MLTLILSVALAAPPDVDNRFKCHVCGCPTGIAPVVGSAVCPKHCPEHKFVKSWGAFECEHCGLWVETEPNSAQEEPAGRIFDGSRIKRWRENKPRRVEIRHRIVDSLLSVLGLAALPAKLVKLAAAVIAAACSLCGGLICLATFGVLTWGVVSIARRK